MKSSAWSKPSVKTAITKSVQMFFFIAALIIVVIIFLKIANILTHYNLVFKCVDADKIMPGSEVKSRGLVIGKIVRTDLSKNYALLTASIQNRYKIPVHSECTFIHEGIMAGNSINILMTDEEEICNPYDTLWVVPEETTRPRDFISSLLNIYSTISIEAEKKQLKHKVDTLLDRLEGIIEFIDSVEKELK